MLISLLGSNSNKRELDWLSYWSDEFLRLGFEVAINPELEVFNNADAVVLLADGRVLDASAYLKIGYFYYLKLNSNRTPGRLLVAFLESGDLSQALTDCFDHITKTDKGLINTVKDYLYFSNKNVRSKP